MNILLSAYSCCLLIVMSVTLFDSHSLQNFGIRASALIFRRIMSAVGTTLLQSPGWNEGKARNATLGKHRQKRIELRRSGTTEHSFGLCHCWVAVGGVPLLKELKGYRKRLTQGLRPGLCRSIALTGLSSTSSQSI